MHKHKDNDFIFVGFFPTFAVGCHRKEKVEWEKKHQRVFGMFYMKTVERERWKRVEHHVNLIRFRKMFRR